MFVVVMLSVFILVVMLSVFMPFVVVMLCLYACCSCAESFYGCCCYDESFYAVIVMQSVMKLSIVGGSP